MGDTVSTNAAQAAENTATEQQTVAAEAATGAQEGSAGQNDSAPDFEAIVQRAVDRATNKLGNENKRLRGELETLRKAKMTEDELKKLEDDERRKELDERDKALTDRENRLIAIKEIKAAGLDDGSDASLAIVDFVMADNEEGIRERVKAFNSLIERIVKSKVDGVFKANGRTPGVGSDSAANAGGANDSIAARIGRTTANTNRAAQAVLDHYLGGK